MSKVKLMIEIDEETAKYIQGIKEFDCGDTLVNEMFEAIHNGTPITEGDLISRSILDDVWELYKEYQPCLATEVYEFGEALKALIDNAPSIGGSQNE